MASTSLQVAGLASNFDWKAFVDQIMVVERTPANRLEAEKAANSQKVSLLGSFGTKLDALQTATQALKADDLFSQRTSKSTAATSAWPASATAGTATGSYSLAVSQLATAASRTGAANAGQALAATSDVTGVTLANAPLASPVTAGTFSINGQQVTVALTDSLQDVFDAIFAATDEDVTASYDPVADKITLVSATQELMLGAANDTSNFLRAFKLGNNGTDTTASSASLGTVKTSAPIASAGLATAVTAVDGAGAGTFTINGVAIAYNVNTDSVAAVLARINQSSAGVTATYDGVNDRFNLTNASTGDLGIAVSESAGGLLGALGLTGGATFNRGDDARFTLNGGPVLTSASNTLTSAAHGVTGLSVSVTAAETQTIEVAADTAKMRKGIEDFIAKFNEVQTFLDDVTKVAADSKGKVTAAALASNREIQEWGRSLRSLAFGSMAGVSGTIARLEHLGIDFKASSSKLEIKDGAKLDAALANKSSDVSEFFHTSTTGFAARLVKFLTQISGQNTDQQKHLNQVNDRIDDQIANIERHLEQRRSLMESAFIQMESAQSKLKSQQSSLDRMFAQNSSS